MEEKNKKELYEKEFEQYKKDNPDWERTMTDSTYYELMKWYDVRRNQDSEEPSDDARNFAEYVWNNIIDHGKNKKVKLLIGISRQEMAMVYMLKGELLTEEKWEKITETPIDFDELTKLIEKEEMMKFKLALAVIVALNKEINDAKKNASEEMANIPNGLAKRLEEMRKMKEELLNN